MLTGHSLHILLINIRIKKFTNHRRKNWQVCMLTYVHSTSSLELFPTLSCRGTKVQQPNRDTHIQSQHGIGGLLCYPWVLLGEGESNTHSEREEQRDGKGSWEVSRWRFGSAWVLHSCSGNSGEFTHPILLHSLHLFLSINIPCLLLPHCVLSVPVFPLLLSHVPFWQTDLLVTSYFFPVLIKCRGGEADLCSD